MNTFFEYVKAQLTILAQAGQFSDSLNKKIIKGEYDLRPADLTIKKFVNGASSDFPLLEGENKKIAGVNDFDNGSELNQDRAFVATGIRVDMGNAPDASEKVQEAVFGGISIPEVHEAKLVIESNSNVVLDKSVTSITQGVSTDARAATGATAALPKLVVLRDSAGQGVKLKFPPSVSVPAKAANINRAVAIRLEGFEIIGR